MGLLVAMWCLLGTSLALPIYPQQGGMHGMASMSFESMRRYGTPNGVNMRPQYGFGDRFPSWWMRGPPAAFPWMPLRPHEHETQQYEYALPVHPPPLPAQQIPLQPPQPGLQAPSLSHQPPAVIPVGQEPLQPGQQHPDQETRPTLRQGDQALVQQQVAPPEGQIPQQLPIWDYMGQNGQSLFPLIQKWLQYESMQPVPPQPQPGPSQPFQPQLHAGAFQPQLHPGPFHPQLHQAAMQPMQPQLPQGPMQPVYPHLEQGHVQLVHPHLHQGAVHPNQGPTQPVYPHLHQGPVQHIQPHFHQGPMSPVHPPLHQGPVQHAYPGVYYMQYGTGPAGSPARLGIVSSEEMQGGPGSGTHAFGALYPGFVGMGSNHGGGGMGQNSAFQGDLTAEDDAVAAGGAPTGHAGVVVVQNGNSAVPGANPPADGVGTPVAVPPLPGNTAIIPEGTPTGQGNILPRPNNNIPNPGPDPAGQSKLPAGVTPSLASPSTQAVSDNAVPLGTYDTAPIGVQKELPPSAVVATETSATQSTTSEGEKGQPPENKWYFQEP
ncbi:ameloblastin [Ambystoma mexicanum]|uniref:ameloblastin n=1 Tax=Ambystoma mexicanum TaxID=8296 RepID=UPI0037E90EA8